uniref:Uncharacterized protein n=1 Tax=Rhizophora mucronata TaxID=61149 RepID=A0A2P2QE67_RHIMU
MEQTKGSHQMSITANRMIVTLSAL